MASVTYQCPIAPETCPRSATRDFCSVHWTEQLVAVQETVTAPTAAPAEPATASPPTVAYRPAADRAGGGPPRIALLLYGVLLPVRAGGLRLGREEDDCASVPGLSELLQLSRAHARLDWIDTTLHIADLGSTNGTFVDDKLITTPTPLWPGRALRLAEDVEVLVVELDEYGVPR